MFELLPQIPLDPIFKLQADFLATDNPNKVNLGIGLYSDESGKPVVLDVVKKAFSQVDVNNFDYQPIGGNRQFLIETANLIFDYPNLDMLAMQATCGGTQALRMFADIVINDMLPTAAEMPTLLVGMPTWGNHLAIFKNFKITKFNHLNDQGLADYSSYLFAIETAPDHSVLLIHGGKTHNPSGQNLSLQEFLDLAPIANKKQIKLFVDSAYFGFGDTFENDSMVLKQLLAAYDNFALGFSYSKNASLYEHRTGALFIKTTSVDSVQSQLQQIARESISMAPGLGQEVMLNILTNYKSDWQKEVDAIRETLEARKQLLVNNLPSKFSYLLEAKGMFGLLPFTETEIQEIRQNHAVFFPLNGRINFAGINTSNSAYLVEVFSRY